MSLRSLWTLEVLALLLVLPPGAAPAGASSRLAARIDHEKIPMADVDALSIKEVRRIHGRLVEVAHRAVLELIDRRLGLEASSAADFSSKRAEIHRAHRVQLMLPPAQALEAELPPERIVARVADEPIRAAALEEVAALRLYRLRGELYLQRRRNLDALIERHLLQLQAKDRGVSLEELEESLSASVPVTEAELEAFVSRERAAGRSVEPQRARPYLEFQKRYRKRSELLEARRSKTQIRIVLQSPERPRLEVATEDGVALGPAGRPALVVFTNYACALCRATHEELDRLLAGPQPPRIVLRDFAYEPVAVEIAALVRCAANNGRAAAVRRHVLDHNPRSLGERGLNEGKLQSLASLAGMTPDELETCVASREIRVVIEKDTRAAQRLGFDEPPAFVAAGVPLSGMQTAESLRGALSGKFEVDLTAQ